MSPDGKGASMNPQWLATYIPGDKIRLRIQIVHQPNLVDIRAIFRRESDPTSETESPVLELVGSEPYSHEERSGPGRHSVVEFEGGSIVTDVPAPGLYRLEEVSATTFDGEPLAVEVGDIIRFRISEEPTGTTALLTSWKFD
jgi:hypothetical protein